MYLPKVHYLLNYVVKKPIFLFIIGVKVFIISHGTLSNDVIIYHYAMTPQVDVPLSLVYGPKMLVTQNIYETQWVSSG
jgi:hypothetical protein